MNVGQQTVAAWLEAVGRVMTSRSSAAASVRLPAAFSIELRSVALLFFQCTLRKVTQRNYIMAPQMFTVLCFLNPAR